MSAEKYLEDMQTIGPSELGKLIGRSTKTVKVDASRRPDTLPRRWQPPGTRKLLWRVCDVREWMQALADLAALERQRAILYSGDHSVATRRLGLLGSKKNGKAANAELAARAEKAKVEG